MSSNQPYVEVRVIRGRHLAIRDSNGLSDPFVRISSTASTDTFQTKVVKKNLNPEWNQTFFVPIKDGNTDKVHIRVFDKDLLKKDKLGQIDLSVSHLVTDKEEVQWYTLQNIESGEVEIGMVARYFGKDEATLVDLPPSTEHSSSGASAGTGGLESFGAAMTPHAHPPTASFYPPPQAQQSMYPPQSSMMYQQPGFPPQQGYPMASSYAMPGQPMMQPQMMQPQMMQPQMMHPHMMQQQPMMQGTAAMMMGGAPLMQQPPMQQPPMQQPVQQYGQAHYSSPQQEKVELHGEAVQSGFALHYQELRFEKMIGAGGFGEVWKGEWAGTSVAIKKILTANMKPEDIAIFAKEISLTSKLRHPNIVPFLGACFEPEFCLVIEFCENGSLFHALQKPMPWATRASITLDVARGLYYLHTRTPPIVHRDVKSLNVLVTKEWKGVVSDFGLTKVKECARLDTRCGSPAWTAPEVLRGQPYNESADVFSFGVVMWEIASQQPPYAGMEPNQIIGQVAFQQPPLRPPIPQNCPDPAYLELMQRCWQDDPAARPHLGDAVEILKVIVDRAKAAAS